MSSTLDDFKDLVNDISDDMLLNVAEGLLKDMILIHDMKEKIDKLEDGLSDGDRAAFWFFAMGLDRDQIDLATNMVIGKRRSIKDNEERTDRKKKEASTKVVEDAKDNLLQI